MTNNFQKILLAIASAKPSLESLSAVQLCRDSGSGFEIADHIGGVWNVMGVGLGALAQPLERADDLRKAFEHLTTLRLGMRIGTLRGNDGGGPKVTGLLKEFVSLMPVLQDLRLWFDGIDAPSSSEGTRGHYEEEDPSNFFVVEQFCDTRLPTLKHFELSNATVSPEQLKKWLTVNGAAIEHLSVRRIALRSDDGTHRWSDILDSLEAVASETLSLRLSCLYEPDGRIAVFDNRQMKLCAVCQPPWNHQSTQYVKLDCEHIAIRSDGAEFPVVRDSAALAWSFDEYDDLLSLETVLERKRWPLNFEKASESYDPRAIRSPWMDIEVVES